MEQRAVSKHIPHPLQGPTLFTQINAIHYPKKDQKILLAAGLRIYKF